MNSDEIIKLIIPLGSVLLSIGAFIGLIKSDLRHILEMIAKQDKEIERVRDSAIKAHERIDAHILSHVNKVTNG